MPTNEKFIQSIVELLDKMIEYQLRGSSLLSDIKSSNANIESEISEILRQVRERLPESVEGHFDEYDQKTAHMFSHLEIANNKLAVQIAHFEKDREEINHLIKSTVAQVLTNKDDIASIAGILKTQNTERLEQVEMTKEVNAFIKNLKSKKTWISLLTAGLIGLAGAVVAIKGAVESFFTPSKTTTTQQSQPQVVTQPQNQPLPSQQTKP